MNEIWLLLDTRAMGGIETHVAELAGGLMDIGERPRVVFLADHGPHPLHRMLRAAGVQYETLPSPATLLPRLRSGRPRVLHTHGYKSNLLGRFAGLLTGTPVVATFHAGERHLNRIAVYDFADRWTSFLGRRIAVSAPIAKRIPWGASLIPNFVAVPARLPPGPFPDTVAFVGRLSPEKGPDQFCALAAQAPGPRYLMYGDGPMRPALEAAADGAVMFQGARAGMADSWPEVGLLAITSRAEGLPLAALEAMAHGIPVAAFAVGGLPDLITDGADGFVAPPGDVAALAAAVSRWRGLPELERMAMRRAAHATVAARFSRTAGVQAVRRRYPPPRVP